MPDETEPEGMQYEIPVPVREDLIDLLVGIEVDIRATLGYPPSMCKLLVTNLLMTLCDNMSKQAEYLYEQEQEDNEPKTTH